MTFEKNQHILSTQGDLSNMTVEQKKSRKEKHQLLETLYWAGVLVWVGLIFGIDSLGLLPQIGGADAWSWVFFGAGLYALLGALWRVSTPDWPDPTTWDYVWIGILLILGLDGLITLEIGFPLILVLIGVALLGSTLWQRH
jgi:hypothetical protein